MATPFEDLRVLKNVEEISDVIWDLVNGWDKFARNTVGKQLVRAVDSIGANIAEAYGRYHYGEKLHFLYYARGSLFETKYWLNRSQKRALMDKVQFAHFAKQLNQIGRMLNAFANNIKHQKQGRTSNTIREPQTKYDISVIEHIIFSEEDLAWLASTPNTNKQSPIPNLQSPQENIYD